MNPVIPIAFKTLCIISPSDTIPQISVALEDGLVIGNIQEVEEDYLGDITLLTGYIEATNGASRRTIASRKDGLVDIIDGGSWGMEGFLDNFYITDTRGDTMTGWFTVSDATPVVTAAPEGGHTVEFTDRITLVVLNHDTSEQEQYTLRDNQVTYRLDDDGYFTLTSIRPKPDDISSLTATLRLYDTETDNENPLSPSELSQKLRTLFPIAGRVYTTLTN